MQHLNLRSRNNEGKRSQLCYIVAMQSTQNCEVELHKALKVRNGMDLIFQTPVWIYRSTNVVNFCQDNKEDNCFNITSQSQVLEKGLLFKFRTLENEGFRVSTLKTDEHASVRPLPPSSKKARFGQ